MVFVALGFFGLYILIRSFEIPVRARFARRSLVKGMESELAQDAANRQALDEAWEDILHLSINNQDWR